VANASVERGKCCYQFHGCFCNYFLYIPTGCRSCDVLPEYDDVEVRKKIPLCEVDGFFLNIHGDLGFKGKRIRCSRPVWGRGFGALVGPMIKETRCHFAVGKDYTPPKFNSEFSPEK